MIAPMRNILEQSIDPKFRGQVVKEEWSVWPLKKWPICCSETSVTNYQPTPLNNPEERRPELHGWNVACNLIRTSLFISTHLVYFLFSYSSNFILTFLKILSISPPLSASSSSSHFSYPPTQYFLILLVCLNVKNIRSEYARHRLNKGIQKVYWVGETISHYRTHWMYHDLTVIRNNVSPTLQISVYYLSRERRGNKKKKSVEMEGNLSLNWV
jgi:hypothetical protein